MSDNIVLTRTSCEYAQRSGNPSQARKEDMNFIITHSGIVNHCFLNNSCDSILHEVKERKDILLVGKLKQIGENFGQNCIFENKNEM